MLYTVCKVQRFDLTIITQRLLLLQTYAHILQVKRIRDSVKSIDYNDEHNAWLNYLTTHGSYYGKPPPSPSIT